MKTNKRVDKEEGDEVVVAVKRVDVEYAKHEGKKQLQIDQEITKFASNDLVIGRKIIGETVDDFGRGDILEVAVGREQQVFDHIVMD